MALIKHHTGSKLKNIINELKTDGLIKDNEFETDLLSIKNFTLWQNHQPSPEIHVVLTEHPIINIDNKFIPLEPGDAILIERDSAYRYFSNGESKIMVVSHYDKKNENAY